MKIYFEKPNIDVDSGPGAKLDYSCPICGSITDVIILGSNVSQPLNTSCDHFKGVMGSTEMFVFVDENDE